MTTLLAAALVVTVVTACGSGDPDVSTGSPTRSGATDATTTEPDRTTTGAATDPALTRKVEYSTTSGRQLDIHQPAGAGPFPVAVVVHGAAQNRSNFSSLASALAAEGVLVYNVDVAMAVPFDETMAGIACAVRFAAATAADHGGDPGHLTLVGNSAGASAGLIVALAGDEVARDCVADDPVTLDAVVGYEGPYDWATTVYGPIDLPAVEATEPDLWAAADPYTHLGGNPDLVVRLLHGDDTGRAWYEIPRAVSVDMHGALVDAGYDAEITLIDGANHTAITGSGTDAFDATVDRVLEVAGG